MLINWDIILIVHIIMVQEETLFVSSLIQKSLVKLLLCEKNNTAQLDSIKIKIIGNN